MPSDLRPAPDRPDPRPRVGYVLKMYPRFSETFVVSEILAREAAGEELVIFSLRPPTDPRFHPELARVQAPVIPVPRPTSARRFWETWQEALADPDLAAGTAAALPALARADADDAAQALALARLVREHGVDHLHAHFASVATTVARLAGAVADRPYSFTAHAKDLFHEDVETAVLEESLRSAHHAVTISAYNVRHLQDRVPAPALERLHLVRNGLELDRFPYRPRPGSPEAPRVLSVGRLVEKKGFVHLVDAAAALREAGTAVRVDIVGDGPLREELADRIARHRLEDRVRLLGPRTQEEVRTLLQEADLFAAPFVVGADGNADGLPTVLLEAMASGIPCVAADVTGVGEVVLDGRTGHLVPSGDTAALATAIRRAVTAPVAERRRLTDAARALVEREHDARGQAAQLRGLVRGGAAGAAAPATAGASTPVEPAADREQVPA